MKQTVYLIKSEAGSIELFQYAPDQNFSGRRDSDQYSLMQGLFIDEPSHDLSLGKVVCHRNQSAAWGINTVKALTCEIVAKCSFNWDMSKPIGQRKSDEVKSDEYDFYFTKVNRSFKGSKMVHYK